MSQDTDFPEEIYMEEGKLHEAVERVNKMLADANEDSRWRLVCMPLAEYEDWLIQIAETRKRLLAPIEREDRRKHLRVVGTDADDKERKS